MIEIVMSTLLPSIGSEISRGADNPVQDNMNSNQTDFGQILGILMAQMGLSSMIPPQVVDSSSLQKHYQLFPSSMIPPQVVDSSSIEMNVDSGTQMTENSKTNSPLNSVELCPLNDAKSFSEMEILNSVSEGKSLTSYPICELNSVTEEENAEIKNSLSMNTDVSKDVNIKESQDEILLQLKVNIDKVSSPLEQQKISEKTLGEEIQELLIPTKSVQAGKVVTSEMMDAQNKVPIKSVELSIEGIPEESQSIKMLKSGGNLQNSSILNDTLDIDESVQQKVTSLFFDINQSGDESVCTGENKNILSRVLENKFIASSGGQNKANSEQKTDLPNANLQIGDLVLKTVKTGNEEMSSKITPVLFVESKEIVSSLSSLKTLVTEQIKFAVRSDLKTITVKLEPESLGTMEIKVQEHSGKIGIQLTTSNNEVHKILSQGLPQLREVLKQEGILVKDVQVISTGTTNFMLNQNFNFHSFSKEVQTEPTFYHWNRDTQQVIEETKPISTYHDGTLNLWI